MTRKTFTEISRFLYKVTLFYKFIMPLTRLKARLETSAAPTSGRSSKRPKQETKDSPRKRVKQDKKPQPSPKKKSIKTAQKHEKKTIQDQANTDKSTKERFLEKVDTFLVKHINELTSNRENLRVFVPLCGNSADMLWLAEKGHSIVGVELTAKYIKSFFKKSELEFEVTSEKMATKKVDVYKAKSKDIAIYHCSIFDFHWSGDKFDGIWDQSAIPVINTMGEDKMKQYVQLLQSLLAQDGRHVVEVCKHGANFVTAERLKQLYGDRCEVRYLGTRMWKYEEEDDECEEEGCGHSDGDHAQDGHAQQGHASHGHGECLYDHHDEEETEMFYHVISFK